MQSNFVFRKGLDEVSQQPEPIAKMIMCLCIVWANQNRLTIRPARCFVLSGRFERDAEVVMRFRPVGTQCDGLAQAFDRFPASPAHAEDRAQVAPHHGRGRICGSRPLQQANPVVISLCLEKKHSEQMKRSWMRRYAIEYRSINLLSGFQVT